MGIFKKTSEYKAALDRSREEKEELDEQHEKIRKDSDFIRSLRVELKSNSRLDEETVAKIESDVSDAEDDTNAKELGVSRKIERVCSDVSKEKKEVNAFLKSLKVKANDIKETNMQMNFEQHQISTDEIEDKEDEVDELLRELDDFER